MQNALANYSPKNLLESTFNLTALICYLKLFSARPNYGAQFGVPGQKRELVDDSPVTGSADFAANTGLCKNSSQKNRHSQFHSVMSTCASALQ